MIVYTKNNCVHCERVKRYLDSKGKEYEVRNIEEDGEALKDVLALGARGVPVVFGDKNEIIIGYNEAELAKL